ncbi:MAG: hypothetical protein JJU36_11390 [Phycisphaeraceae bacterium]|nr:hypothetical protein [Phycisphaeraceae bacterium]
MPADREASADDSRSAAGPAVPERDDRAAAATQTTKPGERSPIREAELARRAEAIQAMRDQLQRELREFGGGSFERWSRSLEAFRQSFRPNRGSGRHEFQFLNAELWAIRADRYDRQEPGQAPFESIVRMNEFLREHDIDLIYMPIPDKVMVYPDLISDQVQRGTPVAVAYKRLLLDLAEAGVEVIDLEAAFRRWRQEHQDRYWLYQAFDTHWNNRGAQIAAAEVARRLERYDFVQQAQRQPRRFRSAPGTLTPGTDMSGRHRERILEDPAYRLPARMVMLPDGSTYEDVQRSPVIMTADSFGRIWRDEGAQTSAQLAYEINLPVTLLHGTGSGPRIPMMLIQEGTDYLEGRRVFIWTGVCRQLARGAWTVLPQDPYSRMDFASSGNGEDDDLLDD